MSEGLLDRRKTCRRLKITHSQLHDLLAGRRYDSRSFPAPVMRGRKTFFRENELVAWRAYREAVAKRVPA